MRFAGFLFATLLTVFLVAILYVFDFSRLIFPGVGRDLAVQSFLKPLGAAASLLPACAAAELIHRLTTLGQSRLGTAVILAIAAAVTLAAAIPISRALKLFDDKDGQFARGFGRAG